VHQAVGEAFELGDGILEFCGALLDCAIQVSIGAGELISSSDQGLVGLGAFDDVGGLTGEEVQEAKRVVVRRVRLLKVCGKHAQRFAGAGEKRRGLDGANACEALEFQGGLPGENGAKFDIVDDDAFARGQGRPASALSMGEVVPKIDVGRRKTVLGDHAQARTFFE
jgi:hypothetical protein